MGIMTDPEDDATRHGGVEGLVSPKVRELARRIEHEQYARSSGIHFGQVVLWTLGIAALLVSVIQQLQQNIPTSTPISTFASPIIPKTPKIKPYSGSKFSGTGSLSVDNFLFQLDVQISIQILSKPKHQLLLLTTGLNGAALTWLHQYQLTNQNHDYSSVRAALIQRYRDRA